MTSSSAQIAIALNSRESSAMTSSTSQIANLNSQGIEMLECGQYKQAAQFFSSGLSVVKQAIACLDSEDDENMESSDVARPISCFHKAQETKLMMSNNKYEDQIADDKPFVFKCPISITDSAIEEEASYGYLIELSFMQLYNLALCHHLSALSSSDTASEKKLQKALSLYELAYTITMTEDIQPTVLQTIAIVNNLGHIHSALGHTDCSQQCFENLLSTIMFIKDCGEENSVEQMDGFLSNVMNLMNNGCTLAAAA